MASLSTDPNGFRRIQFTGPDKKRHTIRLGKTPTKRAETILSLVNELVSAKTSGCSPSDEAARWITRLSQTMLDKLAAVGLIAKRESATLDAFIKAYISGRVDVKPGTATVLNHTRRCLVAFFGAGKSLRDISPGDADLWRAWLVTNEKLADNTVRRRCGIAKQFFNVAIRRRILTENPFADLKVAIQANRSRYHFITKDEAEKVLAACPDAQWRLLFALSRYGGLRCPSEHLGLKWGDVNWEQGRIRVTSPKTEHIEGHGERWIPLFPELRPYLEAVYDEAAEGTEWVITRCRMTNVNLRTRLFKIIRRAGLTPWPKLFQNLRSTRQTELAETFPMHVVTAWIGNSEAVAKKHYLQLTDDHFEQANGKAGSALDALKDPATSSDEKATSKATSQTPANARNASQVDSCENEQTLNSSGNAGYSEELSVCQVGDAGFEQTEASSIGGNGLYVSTKPRVSNSDARSELARLADAWPTLTAAVRAEILTLAGVKLF